MTPLQLIAMAVTGRNGVLMVMTAGTASLGRSGFDNSSSTYGSMTPVIYKGESCVRIRHETVGDTLSIRFDTTGLAQSFWTRLTINGTDWTEVVLSADASAFNDNDGGRTTWDFSLTHAAFTENDLYNCRFH